ncbi:DNA-binding protein [Bacillus sp. FJAT-26390]|uniref:DNA-binding protein n=1 Tax=Bacillus sp. FJAT-26390 TaxID=1743142 RepID=UPI000807D991|nr:DNA-binding protein [Bacillus sp. FJAT-26390]OBZ15141.1 DNA-binding protein [Bacillus sp. FJAT-26390]
MITSKEQLPLILEPAHIQEILCIGRRATYELLADPPFHVNRVGKNKMIKVPRDVFFRWLEGDKEQG